MVETRDGGKVGPVARSRGHAHGDSRLVVDSARGELLIPLADAICPVIDPARKRIVIDPPPGLLDLNV